MTIVKADEVKLLDRGGGVVSMPLITRHSDGTALITTGISIYPEGTGAPLHVHNCDEQVTLLEGVGEVEVGGVTTPLKRWDTTYIPAGEEHAFRNISQEPMTILWIYPTQEVSRTLSATGETIEHLSARDLMS